MRFITEFELKFPYQLSVLETYKVKHQFDIGNQIGEMTDWTNEHDDETDRFKLEIEAFPMDKWKLFLMRLWEALPDHDTVAKTRITNAIEELQSFGKSSEDAIANQ